jgi:ABC-2 type transport system permease protein
MRGVMGGGVTVAQLALALALPVALTLALAPVTLWLYARK